MSEPATEAGRRLLEDSGPYVITGEHSLVERILAIEQEARADLAARIVAAVEGLPGWQVMTPSAPSGRRAMTERDRLAQTLRETANGWFAEHRGEGLDYETWADRLIAAGVGFPREDEAFAAGRLAEAVDAADRADLDVERLARALHHVYHNDFAMEPRDGEVTCNEDAVAIAAAYREDAGIAERDG